MANERAPICVVSDSVPLNCVLICGKGMSMKNFAPWQQTSGIPGMRLTTIPAVRERVGLAVGNGVYLVVAVNAERKNVDLISIEGTAYLLEKIPFSALRRMNAAA
jgi:hypothetical protein